MLDHTLEIGEQKAKLAQKLNELTKVSEQTMAESDKYNILLQSALAQRGVVAKSKMKSKIIESEIRAIKTFLRTETQFG
jgi:hypothetical protein